ncbi:hypothetical protein EB001_14635 [bacterium]|nr:hypothetical protein [bacterium]
MRNGLGLLRHIDLHQCVKKNTEQSHLRNFLFWGIVDGTLLYALILFVRCLGAYAPNDIDPNWFLDWPRLFGKYPW